MHRATAGLAFVAVVALAFGAVAADAEKSAFSWQKQARDTRATVVGVAEELGRIGDKGNPDAAGLITDAKRWLAEGDKNLALADEKMEAKDYQSASSDYNMAWQYYVKAATAGLNAKSILGSK